jgi:hypothetical protein
MRFLLVVRESALHVFHAPIRSLCEQGHEVVVLVEAMKWLVEVSERWQAELEGLTIRPIEEELEASRELALDAALRGWIDYLRYFEPELAEATQYRELRGRVLPESLRMDTDRLAGESPELRRALSAGLRALERALPIPGEVTDLLERERPDAVLVSPLMTRSSPQALYLRAARRLGIPSALCVASWDNLPSKGYIHEMPDLVTVWNKAQRDEAVQQHGVQPERVAVTGAPRFDEWFDHGPTESRDEYCGRLGLPSDRPHILYVGSTRLKANLHEGAWIARWVAGIRESGHPELQDVPVVVRPHPKRTLHGDSKAARRLARTPGVVVHPPDGALVVDEATLNEFFDSLHHAAVVVGLNTSAMIEAAVVGRGVHVLLAKPYRAIQQDSPHFEHLRSVGGGLIVETETMEDHARRLARALRGEDSEEAAQRARAFVASFLRPHGLDRPATPIMVDALRALAASETASTEPDVEDLADVLRPILVPERPQRRNAKARKARKRGRGRRSSRPAAKRGTATP